MGSGDSIQFGGGCPPSPSALRSRSLVHAITVEEAKAVAAGFLSPPVNEVSLAVAFQPIALGVIAASELWRRQFKSAYPTVDEQGPVRMPIERFEGIPSATSFQFELAEGAPRLPRLWFISSDGTELLQLQRDWFARNWRQTDSLAASYPRYPAARDAFERDLRTVAKGVGPLRPLQAEITYINHIDEDDVAAVLVSVNAAPAGRTAEFQGFNSQYVLTRDGVQVGRLYLQAQKALRRTSGEGLVVLTITVRGAPIGDGIEGVLRFLDLGSDEALVAFIQATRPALHRKWSSG